MTSPIQPASDLLLRRGDERDLREVLTPEGVRLRFHVANIGDRALALLIDGLLLLVPAVVVVLVAIFSFGPYAPAIAMSCLILGVNVYYVWHEGRKQGQTPGKRRAGIRVIDRRGGPLTPDAVLARNLSRNLELLLPLAVLASAGGGGVEGAAQLAAGAWVLLFLALPVVTRDRMRAGDMIAGTMVVLAPREMLLQDIGERATRSSTEVGAYAFTAAQLDIYGIYELQVLEKVLRSRTANRSESMKTIAREIRKKIAWTPPNDAPVHVPRFLQDFYAAQRRHLEQRMLLGERRERKRRGPGPR